MRFFLLSLSAVSMLLLPACSLRSSTSDTGTSPPTPIPDSPPVATLDKASELAEPATVSPPAGPEFAFDPAPAPPSESSPVPPEKSSPKPSSAEDVFNSIARVLHGAVEGTGDESGEPSKGSVLGSIGRALGKGFQEAAAGENATDE